MIYAADLSVPANTSKLTPFSMPLPVVDGFIDEVNILFPVGCSGLVGVRIYDFQHIIYPSNPDSWLVADGETIHWSDSYELAGSPNTLTLEGYNEDDSYIHTIYFRFILLGKESAGVMQKFTEWVKSW